MKLTKLYLGFIVISIIGSLLVSCSDSSVKGEVSYQVLGTPLKVTVDTKGEIGFLIEHEIQIPTQIGVFGVGIVVEPAEFFKEKQPNGILTIRLDGKDHFYDLHGRDFNLTFESGYYKKIDLRKSGNNLFLELTRFQITPSSEFVDILITPTSSSYLKNSGNNVQKSSSDDTNTVEPVQFIKDYFSILTKHDYESGWAMMSNEWKKQQTYGEYSDFWATVNDVNVIKVSLKSQSGMFAYVYVEAQYHYRSGAETIGNTTYKLVKFGKTWRFYPKSL